MDWCCGLCRAVEMEPGNLDYLRKAGLCHRSRGDFQACFACYDR